MKAEQAYLELAKAIDEAKVIPPCMNTDPEVWFADYDEGYSYVRTAKKLCAVCPVRAECLNYALVANEAHGIWGGLSPRERVRLNKRPQGRPKAA